MATVDTSLLKKLVERAVQERMQALQSEVSAQHWLLVELVRHLPRQGLLAAARQLQPTGPQMPGTPDPLWAKWHLYLCQQAGLVDGETPPRADRVGGPVGGGEPAWGGCRSSVCL